MTKRFKKGLGIFGAIVAILIVILIAVPFLFKDKIKQVVLDIANEQINARVEIGDFGLNLFSSFPNATLSLKNVLVIGVDAFEKDTLLQAKSASVTIDLFSLFGSNYDISRINLDGVSVYAKLLADGKANWDIMKESSSTTQADEDSSPFNLSLKRITIKDCNIVYDDLQSKMKAVISRWNGTISGDFSASETTLKTNSTIDELTFSMDGIPYLSKAKLSADAALKANFDNMTFVFENSRLGLNELKAFIEGSFAMVGEEGMDFDLKLNAPDTQFKDILSLVPAMYTDDFKNVKTSGTASLDGYLKGRMEGESYPAFDFKINVDNAMFQYPSLPKSVDNINVNVLVNSKGGSLDNTVVDVSKFSFSLGGNPFAGSVRVTTPMSDPNLRFAANGTLDLGMIKDVYPLEQGTELNGKIVADMSVATAMSSIEKEQYEKVSASGTLKVNDMVYKSPDMADVKINDAGLTF
ncbi:AsmA family protein, partial [Parabacteroides sp. OttesenSCG-928-G07]|nr:AsmA family protein [Parabacteroides sp. OttesenSCG-928-G07]